MRDVFPDGPAEMALADRNQPIEARPVALVKRGCGSNRRQLSSAANPGIHRVTRTALPGVGAGQSLSSLGTLVTGARNARDSLQVFIDGLQISVR